METIGNVAPTGYRQDFKFKDTEKIFGASQGNVIIDLIIMTKKVMYRKRMKGKISHIDELKYQIFSKMRLEEYFDEIEEKVNIFPIKWQYLYECTDYILY